MSNIVKIQKALDEKRFDPFALSDQQVVEMDDLFERGILKGYKNTREIGEERGQAAKELTAEAIAADRPIESFTKQNLGFTVERSTMEAGADIGASFYAYYQDRDALKKYFKASGFRNKFGLAHNEKFLKVAERYKQQADKIESTTGKPAGGLLKAFRKVPQAKPFFFLSGFLNKVISSGKRNLNKARAAEQAGLAQPLRTELKSLAYGATGAAAGSAAYDVVDFGAEFATNATVDLGSISDNQIDKMSMPSRMFVKGVDAFNTSLLYGAGATALFGMTGRLLRQFGKGLTGTKGREARDLAETAQELGLPVSLSTLADKNTTFGGITKSFAKVFGIFPFVNKRIADQLQKYDENVIDYYGKYLSTLGPMGYADLLGKEFLDTVKKNHADNMQLIDLIYKQLDQSVKPLGPIKIVPTENIKKYSTNLKERLVEAYGGQEAYETVLNNYTLGKVSNADHPLIALATTYTGALGENITLKNFQHMKELVNMGIQKEGKSRLNLIARDIQLHLDTDLASIANPGKGKKLLNNPEIRKAYEELKTKDPIAAEKFLKNSQEILKDFPTMLKQANDFYSRTISPYSEGMLKKLGQKADANLFTSMGELNIAGGGTVEPQALFRMIGNTVFKNGSDQTVRELKTLIGYNKVKELPNGQKVRPGKKLFDAMRSRYIFDAYMNSFQSADDVRQFGFLKTAGRVLGSLGDTSKDALQKLLKVSKETSPQAKEAIAKSNILEGEGTTDILRGFRPGEVQTQDVAEYFRKFEPQYMGQFNFEQFRKELGLNSRDETVMGRLIELFGDGVPKKGIEHVNTLNNLMKVLGKHYENELGSTSTFLARRGAIGGLTTILAGGAVGFTIGAGPAGILGTLLPTYLLRRLGGFLNDPNNAKALLDIYTVDERKDMLVKQIKNADGLVTGEQFRKSLLQPLGLGLSPRKRQSLQRVLNYLNDEEEDFPGTDPMKVTGEDITRHLLKIEDTPVLIPDSDFDPNDLDDETQAHLYPEVYRLNKMDLKERAMYSQYIDGSIKGTEDVTGTNLNIENAMANEQNQMQAMAQPNVESGRPVIPQQQQAPVQPQVQYADIFPNDELGIALKRRQA